ncbi:MAG: hypothetical protein K5864_07305 [Bacteroidales bacterium]|nr:hypothetical protein [Bacteroidales bacterium]
MKKTPETKVLGKIILLAVMMAAGLLASGSAKAQSYYVIMASNNGTWHYLGNSDNNTTIDDMTTFSYASCVWTYESNNMYINGYYLRSNGNNDYFALYNGTSGNTTTITITGNKIYRNQYSTGGWWSTTYYARYLRYNNGWTSTTTANDGTQAAYTISSYSAQSLSAPTITSSYTTFTALGSQSSTHSNSTYTYPRYQLSGSSTYYISEGESTPNNSTTAPTTTSGITYTWTLNDGTNDDGHVRINATTGEVTYYDTYIENTVTTIKVTATHTASGLTASATKALAFNALPVANPTAISATAKTIIEGDIWAANNYTLTVPSGYSPYKYVTASSSNTSVATVANSDGGFTITGVAAGNATITITAYQQDNTTVAATTTFTLTVIGTGVSGSTVTLIDLEDHNWSYYQASGNLPTGYPTEYLSSPNPRNVKITYRGINATDSKPHLANGNAIDNATAVAISALDGEGQNEMIYYKTLEKSVLGMSGDYPYQVISNPFSKRPSTGSGNSKVYYGFAGWKVVDGGEYISEYADNAVLPLDATIHFTALDAGYTPNCTSAEVVFEATWATATVQTGSSAQTFTGGTYETNFWVLSGNNDIGNLNIPGSCTMSARYPDGTTNFTRNLTGRIRASGDNSKVEFVNMNSTGEVNARGYTFTVGRGVTNSGDGGELIGCAANQACVHTVKVESGKYASLRNFTSGISSGNSVDQFMILGCDYDRARAVSTASYNEKLNITGSMYVAGTSLDLQRASGALYVRCIIKSGNFLSSVAIDNNYTGAGGTQTYYFSVGNSNTQNAGRRYLVMEGGIIKGIAGGMDEDNDQNTGARAFDLRVRGTAQIDGVVYGAAEFAGGRGIRTMVFTGGTINGWIAGGANGTQESGGALNGTSYLYFGGTARAVCANATANTVMNRAVGGNVFGAGCGFNNNSTAGQVSLGTNVVIADESIIDRGVYGGGSYGYTTSTSKIFILGGTVNGKDGGVNGTSYQASITGGVFGGACQNQGGTVNIYMDGGLVKGGVYGGSNATGTVSGNVTMQIDGGQVGEDASHTANIHGGGFGQATVVSRNVELTLGSSPSATEGVTVYGDVYGGSALGSVNGTSANTDYHTYVTMNKGTIYGSLYGGALGQRNGINGATSNIVANVYGPVKVKVYGGSVLKPEGNPGSIFGANNLNGAPQRSVTVDIYGTDPAPDVSHYAIYGVYGGGNRADYTYGNGYPTVKVHNCNNSIEYVYGGGNAAAVSATDVEIYGGNKIGNVFGGGNGTEAAANVNGAASVVIYGGTIEKVFGGSNTNGTISGNITVNVSKGGDSDPEGTSTACAMKVGEVYGGGNHANSQAGTITIGCTGDLTTQAANPNEVGYTLEGIGDVYGGANEADITSGTITLNIVSGMVNRVFGGNNTSGSIANGITVNINKNNGSSCASHWYCGEVYGGGNMADYGGTPAVNIINGTVSRNVYGGGNNITANGVGVAGGNVTMTGGLVQGNVFGGCNTKGTVTGTTSVAISAGTVNGSVYGGGLGANTSVTGKATVTLSGTAHVDTDVYGGGSEGTVNGGTQVTIEE